MTGDAVHADRRDPHQPEGALDLRAEGAALLEQASELAAGRAARTLTPHLGVDLKQTLLAVCAGQRLGEHPSPGPATIQVLAGAVTVHTGEDELRVDDGGWAVLPREPHDLAAREDAVVLLTVHADT